MAYVSVSEWRPEQVTEWLKGLDVCVAPYLHWFSNNEVNGQQLLNLSPDELAHLGVRKIGHQELILGAVEHLRNFHYELDRENLQLLALRVSCAAHSLYNEIKNKVETTSVPTQTMSDVSNVINHVKPLVSWLDRPPFSGQIEYTEYKSHLLRISLEMATCAQRDTFAERPMSEILNCSSKLAKLADSIIQEVKDPMLLQPASLDLATIKKRVGEDLGFFLIPSFHGIHQISNMKLSSPAHQSGKIQPGDEVVQVNYQTVVGWSRKKVLALFDESPNDLLLTLKRRPRHVKMYGQIYMKPYRLPSRKRALPYSRWNDNVPSPRAELLTLPHFEIPRITNKSEKSQKNEDVLSEPSGTSSSSDEEFGQTSDHQNSVSLRHFLPKPRAPIQRRFTLSGPPQPSAQSEQFWRELQLERSWRSSQNNSQMNNSNSEKLDKVEGKVEEMFQLRDKSASLGNSVGGQPPRPSTCINFPKGKINKAVSDLPKAELSVNNLASNDKAIGEERDKSRCDKSSPMIRTVERGRDNSSELGDSNNMSSSNNSSNNNNNNKMTISERNKIKRDAFFNNMDCSGNNACKCISEDSSEKVKRIIENFKSEVSHIKMEISEPDIVPVPGKVSQLIGSFERKEFEKTNRSRTDPEEPKSCLPLAKTTFGGIKRDHNMEAVNKRADSEKEVSNFTRNVKSTGNGNGDGDGDGVNAEEEKENHGQMVNTINDCLLPDRDFYGGTDYRNEDEDEVSNGSDYDYRTRNEAGEIVDTVNLALVELKQRQDHYDVRDIQKEEGDMSKNEFIKEISSSSSTSSTEKISPAVGKQEVVKKPVPTERKSKMRTEKMPDDVKSVHIGPLPPKPRPRMTEKAQTVKPVVKSRTPPEPPPRPESTFSKPKKDSEESAPDRKENISLPTPLIAVTVNVVPPVNFSNSEFNSKNSETKPVPSPKEPIISMQGSSSSNVLNVTTEKPKSSGSKLENLKAMLSLGKKPLSFSSPRSLRKKNAMLTRKRNVCVKDVYPCDNSGILWHRNRKGTAIAPWLKFFFVLQGPNFYGFKSKESQKADLFIHLPGFTCTLAEEVKSKEFAFKIYHTGTAFYFAADSKEDLQQWLDSVSLATICPDDKQVPETVTFSVSDSDSSDPELEPETCFPTSPKMKKFLGSSPVPKPARSHQNLASDSKKTYDIQKRFGSLKKLSSQKHSSGSHGLGNSESGNSSNSEIASLDRKYLRFLGHKNTPLPVPTSQFRSYRRMQPSAAPPPGGKVNERTESSVKNVGQPQKDQPGLVRKTLHLSNPSLIHPDMADYRITQERLAEFRRLRNQENIQENSSMATRHEEIEAGMRSNRLRPPELRGFMTLEQFLLRQEEERQLSNRINRIREKPSCSVESVAEQQQQQQQRGMQQEKRRCNVLKLSQPDPRMEQCTSSNAENISRPRVPCPENPQSKTRAPSKYNLMKFKVCSKGPESSNARETEDCACGGCEPSSAEPVSTRKNNPGRHSEEEEEEPTLPDCTHLNKDPTPDYPGIEYPPVFEPETYTLQYMLKNRRKRNSNKKKGEER